MAKIKLILSEKENVKIPSGKYIAKTVRIKRKKFDDNTKQVTIRFVNESGYMESRAFNSEIQNRWCIIATTKKDELQIRQINGGNSFQWYDIGSDFNFKEVYANSAGEALFKFIHKLSVKAYNTILNNNLTLLSIDTEGIATNLNTSIATIHRAQMVEYYYKDCVHNSEHRLPNIQDSNYRGDPGFHFYYNSSLISGGKIFKADNKFGIASKNSQHTLLASPSSAENIRNQYDSLPNKKNCFIFQLVKNGDINYKVVNVSALTNFVKENGENSSSSSEWNGVETNETPTFTSYNPDKYSVVPPAYATNLNNWTLTFVPAKDNRTENTGKQDGYKYLGRGINKQNPFTTAGGLKYYKPSNNTILCLQDPQNEVNLRGNHNATEPLSKRAVKAEQSIEDFSSILDRYYHYSSNDFIWGKNSHIFPGLIAEDDIQNNTNSNLIDITNANSHYYYCRRRVPHMGAIIVSKKYKIDKNIDFKQQLIDILKSKKNISFKEYFTLSIEKKINYQIIYYNISFKTKEDFDKAKEQSNIFKAIELELSTNESFSNFINIISLFMKTAQLLNYTIETSISQERNSINLYDFQLLEAYTRGHDFIQEDYTTVRPQERNLDNILENSRLMSFDDNYFTYKYSGREIGMPKETTYALIHEKDLLLETDITLGEAYGEQKYFIEAIKYPNLDKSKNKIPYLYKDTFKVKDFLKATDETKYIEEDLEIVTANIDLLQCEYYDASAATYDNNWCDCKYGSKDNKYIHECIYQKLGVCPYRFQTEKHPRRIRTLEQSKSNRFNLIQEVSKVFECYPQFYIEYEDNGKIKLDKEGKMLKHIFFMTEKGTEKYAGFRYEKNLQDITRTIDSNSITTKMYVNPVDSKLNDSGTCTIQTAIDNIGKNSYILNFSYYTKKNILNPEQTQRDIFGISKGDLAFLPTIGAYNKKYDSYSNLIINMTNEQMTTLEAENKVAITGIETALEEREKIGQRLYQFKVTKESLSNNNIGASYSTDYITSDTYQSYLIKYRQQAIILWGLVEQLFFSGNYFTYCYKDNENIVRQIVVDYSNPINENDIEIYIKKYSSQYCKGELFWRLTLEGFKDIGDEGYIPPFNSWTDFKQSVLNTSSYTINGTLGQYKSLYDQVKYWKLERAKILNKINEISDKFYKIYEPYIKEGTWSDSNYLTDNEYYWAAETVLGDSCKPNISYNIKVADISPIKVFQDNYTYDLNDTTYIEDIDFFGISLISGLPNKEKVVISETTDMLDVPNDNSITVQNYSTQFDDLFESITASVQSLTYNENTYKRASNFTAKQYIQTDSLQGTLDKGDLTLIDSNNSNIVLDDSGTQGNAIDNSSSQYKLSGEGLFFSTDGGETWDLGVGPKGFNMDYAKFGSLDASKVQIVDGQYIYFLWDKNGINAYRNPSTSTSGLVDFARFNKYGLSLVEKGNIRLRAGYEFKNGQTSNISGDYKTENELSNQNVGFYLYNDNGQAIFKTETQSDYEDSNTDYSARLSLTGEMFITNKVLDSEDDGSILETSTSKKLIDGYYLSKEKISHLYESAYGNILEYEKNKYYFSENSSDTYTVVPYYDSISGVSIISFQLVNNVNSENFQIGTDYYLVENNNQLFNQNLTKTQKVIGETIDCDLTYNGEIKTEITLTTEDIINNLQQNNITINGKEWNFSAAQNNLSKNFALYNNKSYEIKDDEVLLCSYHNENANVLVPSSIAEAKTVEYYDTTKTPITKQNNNLYFYSGTMTSDESYNYWGAAEDTTEIVSTQSSSVSTKAVGIFINNKNSFSGNSRTTEMEITESSDIQDKIQNAAMGSERLFMIALTGEENNGTVYRNILSILKNGNLYIGGEIRDYRGQVLNIPNLNYIPDEVKIVKPSIIMSNDGSTWCNWKKFFNITSEGELTQASLYDVLSNISDYLENSTPGGSDSNNIIKTDGWYILDPIESGE